MTAASWNLQRLKLELHAFVDQTRPHVHREAAAVGGEGPSCDRLSGSHSEPALTLELPPSRSHTRSRQADIFEQASELGRGIDAEPERDGAAPSAGARMCLGFNSPAWSVRVG